MPNFVSSKIGVGDRWPDSGGGHTVSCGESGPICQFEYYQPPQALKEGRIENVYAFHGITEAIVTYRSRLGFLGIYDWINIPMVYLQVDFVCYLFPLILVFL